MEGRYIVFTNLEMLGTFNLIYFVLVSEDPEGKW